MTSTPQPPEIPHAATKMAGLLIFTGLLAVAFAIYVMVARGVFQENQRLLLVAENSEGVSVGTDLTFSGFPIGRVVRIELGDDGKAHLHIDVPVEDARWLRTSSVFTLERGVVGGARLRAFSGLLDDPPLPDGSRRDVLIGDAAAGVPQLVATMQQLLQNLERMTNEQSALIASLEQARQFTTAMNGRYGALTALLGDEKHAREVIEALARTNQLLASVDKRVFGTNGLMDESQRSVSELAGLLAEARSSLKKVDATLDDARQIARNARVATDDLDALRNEVEASLRRISAMTEELNRKWPFAKERELKLP